MSKQSSIIRLLLIEDNPGDARLLQEMLAEEENSPFAVECVDRLSKGLKRLAAGGIDVILLDISLPDSQGLNTFLEIYSQAPGVPILVISGLDDKTLASKVVQKGAQDYLVKGQFDTNSLLRSLRYAIECRQTQEELRESEKKYRSLVDNIGVGITLISPKMEVLALNRQMKKWFPEVEVSKKSICYKVLNNPPRKTMCLDCPTNKTLKDGEVHESRIERPVGDKLRHYKLISFPVQDKAGKITAAIELVDDITEQKKAEEKLRESEARKGAILVSAFDCIVTIDHQGKTLEFNPAAEKTFGYKRSEVMGKDVAELIIPPSLRKKHHRGMAHYLATGEGAALGHPLEIQAMRADGSEFIVELIITTIQLEGQPLFTAYLRDITERKRMLAELEEARQEKLKMKDQFLSHISHELRSPLTAVHQFITIILDGLAGDISAKQREYMEIVLKNANQLRTMISDLLEVTRADAGRLVIEPEHVSLAELITEAVTTHKPAATEKKIVLSAEVSRNLPSVYADPARVREILTNLIGNALKFTPEKGKITVGAQVYKDDPKFLCISVADNGCGISPQGVKMIFERMFQEKITSEADKASRKGLGLGLYISKELVARQGGQIWVESKLGKGSTFFFTLPSDK